MATSNTYTYDGTFELAFLEDNEAVRSAGKDSDAIEIITRPIDLEEYGVKVEAKVLLRVELGETIERLENGKLFIMDNNWPDIIGD